MDSWKVYSPTEQQPWNAERVAHLHRRVVFGGTWREHQRDLQGTPQEAVDRVMEGEFRASEVPQDFSLLADTIGEAAAAQPNAERLKAWWIYRVLFTSDPLCERLTFMWHDHFATSNLKVNSLRQMKRQNDTLRAHAKGDFGDLLHAMLRDPALLLWLDAPANRRGHANENLGRELMELFTLGIGNYAESDVKNAARSLTGLGIKGNRFRFEMRRHDSSEKTILGHTGKFQADDLADVLLQQPATALHIAGKLIHEFFADGVVSEQARGELAEQLRQTGLNTTLAVETILRSQLFFSNANRNTRICDPLSFLAIPLRALELLHDPPSTVALSGWLTRMGLDLFLPPNVAGWPGGRTWLSTRTVIARANYSDAIVSGKLYRPASTPDFKTWNQPVSDTPLDERLSTLLTGSSVSETPPSSSDVNRSKEANLILRLLTSPQAHLH